MSGGCPWFYGFIVLSSAAAQPASCIQIVEYFIVLLASIAAITVVTSKVAHRAALFTKVRHVILTVTTITHVWLVFCLIALLIAA